MVGLVHLPIDLIGINSSSSITLMRTGSASKFPGKNLEFWERVTNVAAAVRGIARSR
jgi:hypothetical protein